MAVHDQAHEDTKNFQLHTTHDLLHQMAHLILLMGLLQGATPVTSATHRQTSTRRRHETPETEATLLPMTDDHHLVTHAIETREKDEAVV